MLGGVSLSTTGAMESRGPPVGGWMLAQLGTKAERTIETSKKRGIRFKTIFRRFKQFSPILIPLSIFSELVDCVPLK